MPKCGRRTELPPFEGHVTGVMNDGFINRNAPFGTQFTPTFRTKIVGGKPRYVKETQRSFKLSENGGLFQPPIPKLTHDDAVQTDFDQPGSQKTVCSKQHSTGTEWKSHAVLPPIHSFDQTSRNLKNSEEFPNGVTNSLQTAKISDYKHTKVVQQEHSQYDSQQSPKEVFTSSDTPYQPKTYDNHEVEKQHQWKPAAGYSYLPTQAINLSKDQEMFLLHKLAADVANCSLDQAKQVYQEMAAIDRNLSGWGSYTDFGLALQKHGIYPNLNTLRLLASTCISSSDIGYIDYEKMLSFLITAIKKSKEIPQEPPTFYSPRDDSFDTFSSRRRSHVEQVGSEGKLLRMLQQQLLQSKSPLDIEQLRAAFSKADRSHRLTLSQTQVKDICHRMGVPIHEHVINEMLAHCHTHGDGQYLWKDFIDILEKVQPQATGLFIPKSKRPLEYAKKYLQPNENWPHPDPSQVRLQPIDTGAFPSDHQVNYPEETMQPARVSTDVPKVRTLQHQNISPPAALNTQRTQANPGKQEEYVSPRGLGRYNVPKAQPWSKTEVDPWFEGFRKMAEALYRNDLDRKGSMKAEQCRWLIAEYNEIFDLQLDSQDIAHCIERNTTTSGTEIDGLLQHLLAARPP